MKNNKIKAVIFGVGAMGQQAVRLMSEKDVSIVGAIGRKNNIGQDIGELCGIQKLGIKLEKNSDDVLNNIEADVAMLSTEGELEQIAPLIKKCVERKMNVITISQEAFYPWKSSLNLTSELDLLAKANGVTIYGTGIQDVFWSNLSVVLSGACHKISSISGENTALIDHMGPAVAEECFVGRTIDEFNAVNDQGNPAPNPYTVALTAIAAELELNITNISLTQQPVIAQKDIETTLLDNKILQGQIVGLMNTTVISTREGIDLLGTLIGKLTEEGDQQVNKWIIKGEPNLSLVIDDMQGELTTCTNFVNRIPDVINADPGFKTVIDLPKPKHRVKPLHCYVI